MIAASLLLVTCSGLVLVGVFRFLAALHVYRLGRVDAIDHDHDMVESRHRTLHTGLLRTMLTPLEVMTSSPFWLTALQCS